MFVLVLRLWTQKRAHRSAAHAKLEEAMRKVEGAGKTGSHDGMRHRLN